MANTARTEGGLIDERPVEIIDGEVVMMSPAKVNHNRVSGNIYHFFRNYLKGKTCEPFDDGYLLYFSKDNQFIPDGMIVCNPDIVKDDGIYGAPDLVIEVLSPSTSQNDKVRKKAVYGRYGVKEYWIISTGDCSVEVYLPENGKLELKNVYAMESVHVVKSLDEQEKTEFQATEFRCSLFPDLPIPMEMIFEGVTR